jgi:hypothetical protein
MSDSGVQYVVEKISTRATTSVQTSLRSEVRARSYALSKSWESKTGTLGWISGLQLGSPEKKCHLGVGAAEYTIWGMVVASPESGPWCVLWSEVPVACPNMTRSQVTGWNPLEGFTKSSCGKLNLVARSRLPTLERGRGSSWEPRD